MLDDVINDWFESSVTIEESSLQVDIDVVFESIKEASRHICGVDNDDNPLSRPADDTVEYDDAVNLCGANPSIEIRLIRSKREHSNEADRAITISMLNALAANLTMLSNVTTDHAAPIFLKEIVPQLIGAGLTTDAIPRSPSYTLFSHPLPQVVTHSLLLTHSLTHWHTHSPTHSLTHLLTHSLQVNLMNQVYVERGYLGATMIVLYMLLLTTTSVRFITKLRRSGNKTQLQLAGISQVAYWLGNYISDTLLIILSLLSLAFAIFIGGLLTHSRAYSITHGRAYSRAGLLTGGLTH